MENNENMAWEVNIPTFDYSAEMKKIRKSLRKRNCFTICTCLVLVAVLAFGTIQYVIPVLEKRYWDPNASTYAEGITDLELTMNAYTELFYPQYDLFDFEIADTGFATYTITANFSKWIKGSSGNTVEDTKSAVLSKNELNFSAGFWNHTATIPFNVIGSFSSLRTEKSISNLKEYPEYINVLAAVTFPEDLPVDQEYSIAKDFYLGSGLQLLWCAVRTGDDYESSYPACGYSLGAYRSAYTDAFGNDSAYPHLLDTTSSALLEPHFKSMLRFLRDQQEQGTGILPPDARKDSYYADALEYVEEHGINVYGGYVIGSPQTILDLYNRGTIQDITLCDAWVKY